MNAYAAATGRAEPAGKTFDRKKDGKRLEGQYKKVLALMSDGKWRTLREISDGIGGGSEAGVSARLRDLRKPEFGSFKVSKARIGAGLWKYKLEG